MYPFDLGGGDLISVPGAQGRLSTLRFDSGLQLYLGEFHVQEDCELAVNPTLSEPWVGGSLHLVGRSIMALPDGRQVQRLGQQAIIDRIDRPGTSFHLEAEQTIRHVAVVLPVRLLRARLGPRPPEALAPYLDLEREVCAVETVPTGGRLRALATSLFSPRSAGPARRLRLEGTAAQFLSEVIDSYAHAAEAEIGDATDWQRVGFRTVVERIRDDLASPLSVELLAAGIGMTAGRLNQLFLKETGRNCADYIRDTRMTTARSYLQSGAMTVKEVAAFVGYNHVSNFSRAYRERFGEPPSRTPRRPIPS